MLRGSGLYCLALVCGRNAEGEPQYQLQIRDGSADERSIELLGIVTVRVGELREASQDGRVPMRAKGIEYRPHATPEGADQFLWDQWLVLADRATKLGLELYRGVPSGHRLENGEPVTHYSTLKGYSLAGEAQLISCDTLAEIESELTRLEAKAD